MTKLKMLIAAIVAAGIMFGVQHAQAHCDLARRAGRKSRSKGA